MNTLEQIWHKVFIEEKLSDLVDVEIDRKNLKAIFKPKKLFAKKLKLGNKDFKLSKAFK